MPIQKIEDLIDSLPKSKPELISVCVSAVIGSTAAILFIKINVDPAISSGPFVTVTNDIAGIAIYLLTTSYIYSAI